ncbi:hypothetical protein VTN02DRAFT_4816 [Thermoascus thermophilus]
MPFSVWWPSFTQILASRTGHAGAKLEAWHKFPDACFVFEDPETDDIRPTVVFEVGVSEPYSDLQSDMYQWLTECSGVQLVVLVDIKEDRKMRKTRWETPECKQRVNDLLRDFGNAEGKTRHGRDESVAEDSSDEDARSDEEMYKSIKQAIEVDDWALKDEETGYELYLSAPMQCLL